MTHHPPKKAHHPKATKRTTQSEDMRQYLKIHQHQGREPLHAQTTYRPTSPVTAKRIVAHIIDIGERDKWKRDTHHKGTPPQTIVRVVEEVTRVVIVVVIAETVAAIVSLVATRGIMENMN